MKQAYLKPEPSASISALCVAMARAMVQRGEATNYLDAVRNMSKNGAEDLDTGPWCKRWLQNWEVDDAGRVKA
jgi:hypothetical protein